MRRAPSVTVQSGGEGNAVLDQDKLRGARRRFDADYVDIGNEPPLSVDGGTGVLVDRRRLSIQWFSGTILTGLFGAALMSGAVFASLDGETNFAAAPEHVETALRAVAAASATGWASARPTGFRRSPSRASFIRSCASPPPRMPTIAN